MNAAPLQDGRSCIPSGPKRWMLQTLQRQAGAELVQFNADISFHRTGDCWDDVAWSERCYKAPELVEVAVKRVWHL